MQENENQGLPEIKNEELQDLEAALQKMEEANSQLFEQLGLSPHQIHHIVSNRENFSEQSWQELQMQQQALEEILERRIEEAKASVQKKPSPFESGAKGHWIFMK